MVKRALPFLLLFTAVAVAAPGNVRRSTQTVSGGFGYCTGLGATGGVYLEGVQVVRARLSVPAETTADGGAYGTGVVTGGSVCGCYQPASRSGGDGGWYTTDLKLTFTHSKTPDGGNVSDLFTQEKELFGAVGRLALVACGVDALSADGGTPTLTVTTEAWGRSFPEQYP